MMHKCSRFILCGVLLVMSTSCQPPVPSNSTSTTALGALETVTFPLGGVEVEIEVAFTPREQEQGLMFRESMPENHGMLFVYRQPQYMSFWMKNTHIPLSIAFIREDSVIGNIEDMKPADGSFDPVERYHSRYQSLYALEMNQGWFTKHGLKAGTRIELPVDKINEVIAKKTGSLTR